MPICSVCSNMDAAELSPDAQDDLFYLLSDEVCRSLSLCGTCCELARSSTQFVRSARQACLRLSASTLQADMKRLNSWQMHAWEAWEAHDLHCSSEEEKPLHLLKLDIEHNTDTFDGSATSGPVKKKKRRKKHKIKEKKSQRTKVQKADSHDDAKKEIENCENQPQQLVGDTIERAHLRKDGRRVVETMEYKVICLTPEQIRLEMLERSKSEYYMNSLLRCDKCIRWFKFDDVHAKHMEKHSPKNGSLECDLCHQFCPSRTSFRGHMKSHLSRYECKACGVVKSTRQHLLEHYALSHGTHNAGYTCAQCGFHCLHRATLQRHMRAHGPEVPPLTCEHCGEKFKSLGTLRIHSLRHTSTPRYKCPQCERRFHLPQLLRVHESSHGTVSPHYCVECDVTFSSRGGLTTHLRRCRPHRADAANMHACNICNKTFRTSSSLTEHTAWAHEGRRQHACAECPRTYGTRDGLRAHVTRAHRRRQREETLYPCSYCAKTFKMRGVLARHLRIHTGERPYECNECGQKFTQSGTRATHIRLVHRKLPRKPPAQPRKTVKRETTELPALDEEKPKIQTAAY